MNWTCDTCGKVYSLEGFPSKGNYLWCPDCRDRDTFPFPGKLIPEMLISQEQDNEL